MRLIWLEDPLARSAEHVGGKAATLGLLAANYRVPPGFCLVFESFDAPDPSLDDLAAAYGELSARCGVETVPVAVRSSGSGEDGSATSFAGQHETFLNVRGVAPVLEAVRRCRASARSPRALAYRARHGLGRPGGFTVLVQQLIPAASSAIAFSLNPVTGVRDEVLINANWGLGESIAGGHVTPDAFSVGKMDKRIVSRRIAAKKRMTVLAENGTRDADVPLQQRNEPSLTDPQVLEVAGLCAALEARFAFPVDLECAFYDDTLYLLQCRPITAF